MDRQTARWGTVCLWIREFWFKCMCLLAAGMKSKIYDWALSARSRYVCLNFAGYHWIFLLCFMLLFLSFLSSVTHTSYNSSSYSAIIISSHKHQTPARDHSTLKSSFTPSFGVTLAETDDSARLVNILLGVLAEGSLVLGPMSYDLAARGDGPWHWWWWMDMTAWHFNMSNSRYGMEVAICMFGWMGRDGMVWDGMGWTNGCSRRTGGDNESDDRIRSTRIQNKKVEN